MPIPYFTKFSENSTKLRKHLVCSLLCSRHPLYIHQALFMITVWRGLVVLSASAGWHPKNKYYFLCPKNQWILFSSECGIPKLLHLHSTLSDGRLDLPQMYQLTVSCVPSFSFTLLLNWEKICVKILTFVWCHSICS